MKHLKMNCMLFTVFEILRRFFCIIIYCVSTLSLHVKSTNSMICCVQCIYPNWTTAENAQPWIEHMFLFSGEPLKWGEECCIKHLPTRQYLAVVEIDSGQYKASAT